MFVVQSIYVSLHNKILIELKEELGPSQVKRINDPCMKQLSACVTSMVRFIEGYYNGFNQSSNNDIDIK